MGRASYLKCFTDSFLSAHGLKALSRCRIWLADVSFLDLHRFSSFNQIFGINTIWWPRYRIQGPEDLLDKPHSFVPRMRRNVSPCAGVGQVTGSHCLLPCEVWYEARLQPWERRGSFGAVVCCQPDPVGTCDGISHIW